MIGFIDHSYTQLGTAGDNSATADLHKSQFTVTHTHAHARAHAHTLVSSVFTSRILATDFNTGITPIPV
jgi:hypothetical protein